MGAWQIFPLLSFHPLPEPKDDSFFKKSFLNGNSLEGIMDIGGKGSKWPATFGAIIGHPGMFFLMPT